MDCDMATQFIEICFDTIILNTYFGLISSYIHNLLVQFQFNMFGVPHTHIPLPPQLNKLPNAPPNSLSDSNNIELTKYF